MVSLLIVFVLGIIGVVLIGSILGLTSSRTINELKQQNRNLNARLARLEESLDKGEFGAAPSREAADEITAMPQPQIKAESEVIAPHTPEPVPVLVPVPAPVSGKVPLQAASAISASSAQKIMQEQRESKPVKPTRNLEELIGGQWSVWVGGLALLVGSVLLIRFSIEAGFFGPGARITMALILGAVLTLAGEWLKRSDDKVLTGKLGEAAKALQGNASVPSLLSAVGIFTLLGASYAAHAVYDLIPAFAAFMALALISLGAMALSLRQGPLLAGIGLLASLATPLLIQTDTPSLLMLIAYLVLIGGAALALSRLKDWGWLATGTVLGWLGWSFMTVEAAGSGQIILWSAFLALGFFVTVWFAEQKKSHSVKPDDLMEAFNIHSGWALAWGAGAAVLVTMLVVKMSYFKDVLPVSGFTLGLLSIGCLTAVSLIYRKQSAHLITAGCLSLAILTVSEGHLQNALLILSVIGLVILSFFKTEQSEDVEGTSFKRQWNIFAVALGLMSVGILNVSHSAVELDLFHAGLVLGFTGLFVGASIWFLKRGQDWETVAVPFIGAGVGWVFAAILMFENLHLSLFMSFGAILTVLAIWRLYMPGARLVLLGLTGLVFTQALLLEFPTVGAISTRPVLNALWIYLALPTVILALTAYVLNRETAKTEFEKTFNGIIEAAALGGLALFAVFQIRHLSNGGEVYADSLDHAELGLQVSIGLCFTLAGLSRRFAGNLVLAKIAEIISYITLGLFAFGALLVLSPFFQRGEAVTGNVFFNSLTTGLLVPTVLLGACAVMARGKRSNSYIYVLGGLALAGGLSWVTAMVRFIYNGSNIRIGSPDFGAMELWTISAIWLAVGVMLLALGVWRKEQALRITSGIVIILTVFKAFLIDMAGLEGVLRALSFVALGLILIVIGRAYQRFWLVGEGEEKEALGLL